MSVFNPDEVSPHSTARVASGAVLMTALHPVAAMLSFAAGKVSRLAQCQLDFHHSFQMELMDLDIP